MRKETLRMERVSYQEQGTMLLDSLSLHIFEGEILGLVPINSFGVAELTNVLCHNLPLHYGYVYYNERLINTWRHTSSVYPRIALIQNQSSLAPDLTVAENIFILGPNFSDHIISYRHLKTEFGFLAQKLGIELDPDTYADDLTVFERVCVELMKAIHAGCRLAILWDVSTFVSEQELRRLHQILRQCAREGMSFLYISPHLEDAEELCQRTLCMHNGQIIKSFAPGHKWPAIFPFYGNQHYYDLVRSQIDQHTRKDTSAPMAFEAKDLHSASLDGLSFYVKQGECLVVQDMDNRVVAELLQILQGECPCTGQLLVNGKALTAAGTRQIAIIQELATKTMLFPHLSYIDNLCFTLDHRIHRIWNSSRLKNGIRRDLTPLLGSDVFDKSIPELTEQQKYDLVYTRVLLQKPDVVFCVWPYKGAEMAIRLHICRCLERLLERGIAVVILAVNLADSLALAERVLQIREGRQLREYLPEQFADLPNSTPWRRLYEDITCEESQEPIPSDLFKEETL